HGYFGKQGITSKGTKRDKRDRINLQQIEDNLKKYSKKTAKGYEINLGSYKILGKGEVLQGGVPHKGVKNKLIITAESASKSAIEKVKAKGGEIIFTKGKKKEVKKKFVEKVKKNE
ncbi:MAG: uL15 family ribosomal protein, partial [Nanoarchaeota archaeon]|nr:uL15 family ribosomal protein [Nanoarchaeota archaeon]